MANTYTQLHHQFVFCPKFRLALIDKSWNEQLHKYITAIVQDHKHKMLQINSMPDHIHLLIGMRPYQAISSLVQIIKTESTKWINEKKFCLKSFKWQEGFGGFSYKKSDLPGLISYIRNQENHHRKKTFREEYIGLLEEAGIEFNEQYIFKDPL